MLRLKILDAAVLRRAVKELSTVAAPVVASKVLKKWFHVNGYDWGEDVKGRTGRFFELADHEATRHGQLAKWKNGSSRNAAVGWSLSDSIVAANKWAEANGWKLVTK